MASIKLILDKRKVKADGNYPICFLICHNRKTTTRSAKISIPKEDWDDDLKIIKKSNSQHKLLNLKLKKDFADIQSQLLLADEEKVQEFLKPATQVQKHVKIKKTVFHMSLVTVMVPVWVMKHPKNITLALRNSSTITVFITRV